MKGGENAASFTTQNQPKGLKNPSNTTEPPTPPIKEKGLKEKG